MRFYLVMTGDFYVTVNFVYFFIIDVHSLCGALLFYPARGSGWILGVW